MKPSQTQIDAHQAALKILEQDPLTHEERLFVLANWRPHVLQPKGSDAPCFTPHSLAMKMAGFVFDSGRVIDLCAGIGALAYAVFLGRHRWAEDELVCVDIDPSRVQVGQKILPQATWICADVLNLPQLGEFETAITHPPCGNAPRTHQAPRYPGSQFEYHVLDVASDRAKYLVGLIPQKSAPFCHSGVKSAAPVAQLRRYEKFSHSTGIHIMDPVNIDTAQWLAEFDGKPTLREVVLCDLSQAREHRLKRITEDLVVTAEV